jgi:hypothetical protein
MLFSQALQGLTSMQQTTSTQVSQIFSDPLLQAEIRNSGLTLAPVQQTTRSSAVGINRQTGQLEIFINPNDHGINRNGHSLTDMVRFEAHKYRTSTQTQSQPLPSIPSPIASIYTNAQLQAEIRNSGLIVGKVQQTTRSSAVGINRQTGQLEIFINPNDRGVNANGRSLASMVRFEAQRRAPNLSAALHNHPALKNIVQQSVAEGYIQDASGKSYYIFGGAASKGTNFCQSKITLTGPAPGGGSQQYTFETPEAAFQAGKSQDPRHWAGLAVCRNGDAAKGYVKTHNLNANLRGWHGGGAARHMKTVVSARAAQDPNFKQLLLHLASNDITPVEIAMDGVPGKHNHQDNKWAAQVTMSNGNLTVGSGDNNYLGRIMEQEGKKLLNLQRPGAVFARPSIPFQPGSISRQRGSYAPPQAPYIPRPTSIAQPTSPYAARYTPNTPVLIRQGGSREARLPAFDPQTGKRIVLPKNFQGNGVAREEIHPGTRFKPRAGQGVVQVAGGRLLYVPSGRNFRPGEPIVCRNSRIYASGRVVSPRHVPARLVKQAFRPPLRLQLSIDKSDVLRRGEILNARYLGMRRSADGTGLLHVLRDPRGNPITISARQMKNIIGQHRFRAGNVYTFDCRKNGKISALCDGKNITNNRLQGNPTAARAGR